MIEAVWTVRRMRTRRRGRASQKEGERGHEEQEEWRQVQDARHAAEAAAAAGEGARAQAAQTVGGDLARARRVAGLGDCRGGVRVAVRSYQRMDENGLPSERGPQARRRRHHLHTRGQQPAHSCDQRGSRPCGRWNGGLCSTMRDGAAGRRIQAVTQAGRPVRAGRNEDGLERAVELVQDDGLQLLAHFAHKRRRS